MRRSLGAGWACVEEVEGLDLLAVGLWRSTGHRRLGVEVKVSRGDWLRELRKPGKARTHLVDAWTILTVPGVAKLEELPDGWGLAEIRPGLPLPGQQPARQRVHTLRRPRWGLTVQAAIERQHAERDGVGVLHVAVARRASYAEADARALVQAWPGTADQLARALRAAQHDTGRIMPGIGVYGAPRG
jgi:hypothetical protein